ncbi:MAG: hypothetical protein A2511_16210 [Deltaproteobacteria bacterium RIFOXYD12_FULL_50_9]|nr:MAG: hypothetical protein A2511_16210 [Deltaproteobacteria bacterium RIFOXYD12_FULL_50_9]
MTTLEKVQKLERYLSLRNPETEPVIDKTIDKLLDREILRLSELLTTLRSQLADFEKKYCMSTQLFRERFERGEMGDAMDYMEWAATNGMLINAEKHLYILAEKIGHEPAH